MYAKQKSGWARLAERQTGETSNTRRGTDEIDDLGWARWACRTIDGRARARWDGEASARDGRQCRGIVTNG